MNSAIRDTLTPQNCREAMQSFWDDQLAIESRGGRLHLALPILNAEGWQITVALEAISKRRAILTDLGETISWLECRGMSPDHQSIAAAIYSRPAAAGSFELQQEGLELKKEIALPLQGIDVQLFGEALAGLTYLIYQHELAPIRTDHVSNRVRQVLESCNFDYRTGQEAIIGGSTEKSIQVDFLIVQPHHSIACQAVNRRGRMKEYMERWGYRWIDVREKNPALIRAMIYDPDNQEWDPDSLNIGRTRCEIFHPYFETDRIKTDLQKYREAA